MSSNQETSVNQGSPNAQISPAVVAALTNAAASGEPPITLGALDSNQIMSLLRHLPGVFNKLAAEQGKDSDAAQTLSNLSQNSQFAALAQAQAQAQAQPGTSGPNQSNPFDAGPSSHPRGPPNLGQLSALASQSPPLSGGRPKSQQGDEMGGEDDDENAGNQANPQPGTKRGGRSATMGSEEWTRQRKDNHKEVERRRRGNINEGINELGRIVPNGSGEKAKGAILSRAVQYIHHLKENEARNIEKWTLEKLLMDQAMGDLQGQLEEMRRLWEEERALRQKLESAAGNVRPRSPEGGHDGEDGLAEGSRSKRQRVN